MKKFIIFLRLNWLKMLVIAILTSFFICICMFIYYSFTQYFLLEPFSRRQIMATYGLLFIVFLMVHLVSMPLTMWLQYFMLQGGFSKMMTASIDKVKVNIKWDDVIGMEGAKKEAWEIVKLLKDRHLVKSIGGKIVKGTMMIGPPGCGKTYLAKAIATECGLPLLPAVGSDFVGIFVGLGAAKMRSLFKQARSIAKIEGGCIIFIDEIDSFARPRTTDRGFGGVISHNACINQFLTEMDGLRQTENNIAVIAATNVPEGELDSAIMRSGRFDRKIYVSRPNLKERKLLFDFYFSKVKVDPAVDSKVLARKSLWFSPADIDNMIREAGLIASRETRDVIANKDLSEAYDRVVFGMKSNIVLTSHEKEWTAYHEAGHAIIGYLLHPTDDIVKATIIPRKGYLGMVSLRPTQELYCPTQAELLADIKVFVASYVAEKIKFGYTSTGVGGGPSSDFYIAMDIARKMVWSLGMGSSGLIGDFRSIYFRSGGYTMSEKTKEILDKDVQEILGNCLKEVEGILKEKRDLLEEFSKQLFEKEELEYDEVVAIFDKFNLKPARRPDIEL